MRLLIAYDGIDAIETVLADLGRGGLPESCDALVFSVVDSLIPPLGGIAPEGLAAEIPFRQTLEMVEHRREQAKGVADLVQRRFPGWQVRSEACADSPGWGIIRRAEGWNDGWQADLVVVGATEKSAFGRILLGSVSQQVATYARCSVRIVRPSKNAEPGVRLLIGADGSANSDATVQVVCSRAWPAGSSAQVIAVLDARMFSAARHWAETEVADTRAAAEMIVRRAEEELKKHGLKVSAKVLEGKPGAELVKQAGEWGADCLFVGARGLTRIERILLGSVSSTVALRAPCTVEIVRKPET
jgi:nucleotide-binding universal stress UspA family protein